MNEKDKTKISISKLRELTSDYKSSDEEVQDIINQLYILSSIVYNMSL